MGMRSYLLRWTAILCLVGGASGCFVSQKKHNALMRKYSACESQREALQQENAQLMAANDALRSEKLGLANDLQASAARPKEIDAELERLHAELARIAAGDASISVSDANVVSMGDVLFDFAKAELRAEGRSAVAKIAGALKSRSPSIIVRIDGHTDNIPIGRAETKKLYPDLWALSAARSMNVLRAFEKEGIASSRLYFRGFGPERPVTSNSTADGRQKNRRVEISFVTRYDKTAGTN